MTEKTEATLSNQLAGSTPADITTSAPDKASGYPFHPASNLFPLMSQEELSDLAADIKANGLQQPIWLYESQILDGRNRALACDHLGISPTFADYRGTDPLQFVVSLNLKRRHLSTAQRAFIADQLKESLAEQAALRMRAGVAPDPMEKSPQGATRDLAGTMVGVSGKAVDAAHVVKEKGAPELVEATQRGEIRLFNASTLATLPKEEQVETLRQGPERVKEAVKSLSQARKPTTTGNSGQTGSAPAVKDAGHTKRSASAIVNETPKALAKRLVKDLGLMEARSYLERALQSLQGPSRSKPSTATREPRLQPGPRGQRQTIATKKDSAPATASATKSSQ
jgi:ParB-like nuclease domain